MSGWLSIQGVHWYFDRQVILLRGREIPRPLWLSRAAVNRVFAQECVVLGPLSERDVAVKVVRGSLRTLMADWLQEPHALA